MDQRTDDWFAARLGKVTASRVKDVMAKTKSGAAASRQNYMMELLCERLTGARQEGFTSAAMQRGTDLEPIARSAYEVDTGVMVSECGLVLHSSIPDFGASPDGIVGSDGLLEIKCPNTAQHVWCLRNQRPLPEYEWQMTAQMSCTGRKWVDFVSFDDRLPDELQYFRFRYSLDELKQKEMEDEIKAFLAELSGIESEMRQMMAKRAA